MRDSVTHRGFLVKKAAENVLHRLFPRSFVPLYSMVTFSRTPYAEAVRKAHAQDRLLIALGLTAAGGVAALAASLIASYTNRSARAPPPRHRTGCHTKQWHRIVALVERSSLWRAGRPRSFIMLKRLSGSGGRGRGGEVDFGGFGGRQDFEVGALPSDQFLANLQHSVDVCVTVGRIVMEEGQATDSGRHGRAHGILAGGMAPTHALGILFLGVLGIVNEQIGPMNEL